MSGILWARCVPDQGHILCSPMGHILHSMGHIWATRNDQTFTLTGLYVRHVVGKVCIMLGYTQDLKLELHINLIWARSIHRFPLKKTSPSNYLKPSNRAVPHCNRQWLLLAIISIDKNDKTNKFPGTFLGLLWLLPRHFIQFRIPISRISRFYRMYGNTTSSVT